MKSYSEDIYDGVTCWPEAVRYLLRTYSTSGTIRDEILYFRDTQQNEEEDKRKYSVRLLTAAARCVNVHSSEENTTMFVDGLNECIKILVAHYREQERMEIYLDVVYLPSAVSDEISTRNKTGLTGRKRHVKR